jgi:3-hydroxyisobutyrate dehydrogenase-like beta-hydroxyacid dehydrogenase
MSKERIGFVGLGYMGHGMANNLMEKGHPVIGLAHRKLDAIDDLVAKGAQEAADAASLMAACDVAILCLANSDQVEKIVLGEGGLLKTARPGQMIIDTTTANPVSTLMLAERAKAKGVSFVDAPLGRTPKEAWAGTLDVMLGCAEDEFRKVEAIMRCFAAKIVRIGDVGAGHQMKLINNFLSMGYGALYAEALALARKVGISAETFDTVVRGGRMDCGFYQTFITYTLTGDPKAHLFALENAAKDTRYIASMADSVGLANPMGSAAKNSYALAVQSGYGDLMVPMLADVVAELNGVALGYAPGKKPQITLETTE